MSGSGERATADVVELRVEKFIPGGQGMARDAHGVLMLRGALPGERVRARIEKTRKGARQATLLEVLEPSADRIAPDCALHPRCGGCDWLDVAPAAAARGKQDMMRDALVRVGRFNTALVERVLRSTDVAGPTDDARRRRARFVVGERGALTFSERGAHERVPLPHCPALHPTLDAARAALATRGLPEGTELKVAIDDDGTVSVASPGPALEGELRTLRGEVAPGVLGGPYLSDASVFTQATRFGGAQILRRALEACGDVNGAHVLELFAGAGHFTLALLQAGAHVQAVEGNAASTAFLSKNVALAGRRCTIATRFIDGALPFEHHDVLLADPPRTGIPDFAALLRRTPARRLVLVSCDVATGARDLALARDAGFQLQWVQPVDAFPRTSHVETIALLQKE